MGDFSALERANRRTNLAQKAIAAGFSGEQVDGNDVIAVREAYRAALKKAREKNEPTLLEIICYRQSDHTTADDASRYEPKGIRETEWVKEPIMRLRHYLESIKCSGMQKTGRTTYKKNAQPKLNKAVADYLEYTPRSLLNPCLIIYMQNYPHIYAEQREQLIK